MKARAAVVGVTALGLALYGLLGGGAKSSVVPFQGKNVSTVQTDKYSVAVTFDQNGPGGTDDIDALAMGPHNSLYFYWQIHGVWYGPLQIGAAGTAFSGPGIDTETNGGATNNLDAAVEGPNHTLYSFWQIGSKWYGPLQIGGVGSTWSRPSVAVDANGDVNVDAQGPNGSLYHYWGIAGSWHGPLQIAGAGTTFSAPSAHDGTGNNCGPGANDTCLAVAAKGPANESLVYWSHNGTWTAPSTSGQSQEYSSPSIAQDGSVPNWTTAYQGPANSLISQLSTTNGGSNSYCVISGAGSTYGAPTEIGTDQAVPNGGVFNIAAAGPSNSLYAYWFEMNGPSNPTACPAFYGPLQLSGAGTLHSVPSNNFNRDSSGVSDINVLAEGPSNTLWVFWNTGGTWYGPLQIGGPGTTFDSAN